MNKNDFYKELMSEYSFDKDEILKNAKKGRMASQKHLPMYIGVTAAAAAVVVTAGTLISVGLSGRRGAELVDGSALASLSDEQRMEKAMEEIRENENSAELRDVLITFASPLSPDAVRNVLTAEGSIPVKMLYLSDGSRVVGEEAVAAVFGENSQTVTGAVVNCAGYLMSALQNDSAVIAVEIITENDNMDLVAPINADMIQNSTDSYEPNDDYVYPGDNTGGITVDISGTTEDSSEDTSTEESSSEQTADTSEDMSGDESEGSSESSTLPSDTSEPTITEEPPITSDPSVSESTEDKLPEGVALPGGKDKISYTTENIDAKSAFFLTDNVYYVRKADSIALYSFDGNSETLLSIGYCEEPRVCFVSENGGRLLVSGCTDGVRNRLFYVNANSGSISEIDVSGVVMSGAIEGVVYNETVGELALSIFDGDTSYVSVGTLTDGCFGYQNDLFLSVSKKLHLLAADSENVYFTSGSNVYSADIATGNAIEIIRLGEKPSVSSNYAGTYGIVTVSDGTYIFDPSTESLLAVNSADVTFGAARNYFYCDGYYEIAGGSIVPASGVSVIGKIEFKRSFSSLYQASVSEGCVRIFGSSYNSKAYSEWLYFDAPTENASAELRGAVNRAVGVQNVLAMSKFSESGIDTAEKLCESVKAAFGSKAAAELKNRCSIAETGSVSASKGGLGVINVSDTLLVVNSQNESSADCSLYIKTGTYGGNSGYYVRNVKLSVENGVWKCDGIIE